MVPTNITVENGMETTLPCVATGASTIIYVWSNDNISAPLPLPQNSSERIHFIANTTGTLMFNEVIMEDEDVYVCMAIDANNINNRIISHPVYLTGELLAHS